MKCPNCDKELEEGKLYCQSCGQEIQIVPDFEPEIENSITETLSQLVLDVSHTTQATVKHLSKRKKLLVPICFLGAVCLIFGITVGIQYYQENSYQYQFSRALNFGEKKDYVEASLYLERAIEINNSDPSAILLLVDYYKNQGQKEKAETVLIHAIESGNGTEEVYRKLIGLYEANKEYEEIGELLKSCTNEEILKSFQTYTALEPTFSVEEGNYKEIVPLKLTVNTSGTIYYTLDGKEPSTKSKTYTAPIYLESGSYIVSAVFVNDYEVRSQVVTKRYYIDVERPDAPSIYPESGSYEIPTMISVEIPENSTVYYTTDGSAPTQDSIEYTYPLPMPINSSLFKFVALNEQGVAGETVERLYELKMSAHVSASDAVNIVVMQLMAQGVIQDTGGKVEGKVGRNLYLCNSAFSQDAHSYYLINEQYEDIAGTMFKTGDQYAVNVLSGACYKMQYVTGAGYVLLPLALPVLEQEEIQAEE